jgi:glycosyltransferase involved in cell wall biosynthesis
VPKRLLLVVTASVRGGAEDYALTIGRAATAAGWRVRAALPHTHGTATLRRDFETAGISLSPITAAERYGPQDPESTRRMRSAAAAGYAREARRFRPDVVHVTLPWPTFGYPFLVSNAVLGFPTLVAFQLVPEDGLYVRRRRRLVYTWMRKRRQRWIAVSDHGRGLIGGLFGADEAEIGLIRNGARTVPRQTGQDQLDQSRVAARRELGLAQHVTVLLSVGRLHAQKGQADLVSAVAGLRRDCPDVHLLVAGEGPERPSLESLIRALDLESAVQLLGHRTDVGRLMDAADVFVFPSHFEGTPFAMLEAMARGLPVVAARFGGVDEIVDDGRSGILVPVGRPDALRDALAAALDDESRLARIAAAGRERAADFNQDAMAAATLRELEALCGR